MTLEAVPAPRLTRRQLRSLNRGKVSQRDSLIRFIIKRVLSRDPEYRRYGYSSSLSMSTGLVDYLFAASGDPHAPDEAFERLRWGGQFIFISCNGTEVADLAQKFARWGGYEIEQPATALRRGFPGLPFPLPWLSRKIHYFIARKVLLLKPGESSDRFSYHVKLLKNPHDGKYIVMKQVPAVDRVVSRLHEKFPDEEMDALRRRARKFTDKIFPVFLTREAAILKILQRDLPNDCKARTPKVIGIELDQQNFARSDRDDKPQNLVRTLYMTWLRNAHEPLSQLEFARESAELLAVLHDKVGIIHLDLRLDNFVITENGVGFVDFGSAVRVGEVFAETSLLNTLFDEMMRTSQIQRMLTHMKGKGLVTSREISAGLHKVDKAVDFFYLAVQISAPHGNPDLKGLILFDPKSQEAMKLAQLTEEILRPKNIENSPFKSAHDILEGIEKIQNSVAGSAGGEKGPHEPGA